MVYQSERERRVWRCSIQSELLSATLKSGGWIAASGALLLLMSGIFLPKEMISLFGIPIFITGLALIAIGLLPYRRLLRLQLKPHEIHDEGEYLIFLQQGKPLFKICKKNIQKIAFLKKENIYGLGVWLKRPLEEKIKVLQPNFDFAAFMADSVQRFEGCDLFLPYFTERSCEEIKDQLE